MYTEKRNGSLFLYCLVALLLILTASIFHQLYLRFFRDTDAPSSGTERYAVILDAGHGGFDGGAVSLTGTPEKVINLELTLTLSDLLTALGYDVILTRASDTELTSSDGGSRKMQDLRGRLTVAENNPHATFLSIHMNKFPQSRYQGLQVYYSPHAPASKTLADTIQASVHELLQPDNNRTTKASTTSIYLLHRIHSPAVLIECGFLSNPDEATRLEDPDYRTRLAVILAGSYATWQAAENVSP